MNSKIRESLEEKGYYLDRRQVIVPLPVSLINETDEALVLVGESLGKARPLSLVLKEYRELLEALQDFRSRYGSFSEIVQLLEEMDEFLDDLESVECECRCQEGDDEEYEDDDLEGYDELEDELEDELLDDLEDEPLDDDEEESHHPLKESEEGEGDEKDEKDEKDKKGEGGEEEFGDVNDSMHPEGEADGEEASQDDEDAVEDYLESGDEHSDDLGDESEEENTADDDFNKVEVREGVGRLDELLEELLQDLGVEEPDSEKQPISESAMLKELIKEYRRFTFIED